MFRTGILLTHTQNAKARKPRPANESPPIAPIGSGEEDNVLLELPSSFVLLREEPALPPPPPPPPEDLPAASTTNAKISASASRRM